MSTLPSLPPAYQRFLQTHDGSTEFTFNDLDGWRLFSRDELVQVIRIGREQEMNIFQLRAFAKLAREFHGDETEDHEGEPYCFERLGAGLAIGDNNGDVLFLDPADANAVWVWYHDGADVERIADSFDEWLQLAT